MRLSPLTLKLLKSFIPINPAIRIKPGPVLACKSSGILATAKTDQEFPTDFALPDIQKLLGILSLLENPEIEFKETCLVVSDGTQNVRLVYAAPGLIVSPLEDEISFTSDIVEFEIDENTLSRVRQAQAVLRTKNFTIKANGKGVFFGAGSFSNPFGDTYATCVGKTKANFTLAIPAENLKILPGRYKVGIGSKKGTILTKWDGDIATYYVAPTDEEDKENSRGRIMENHNV
jgi:hypothetical protein